MELSDSGARHRDAGAADRLDAAAQLLSDRARGGRQANLVERPRAAAAQQPADDHRPRVADHPGIARPRPVEGRERQRFREIAGELHAPGRPQFRRHDPAIAAAAGLGIGVGEPGGPIYSGNVASLV